MICKECKKSNPSYAQRCIYCGGELIPDPKTIQKVKVCEECNKTNPSYAQRCTYCGGRLVEKIKESNAPLNRQSGNSKQGESKTSIGVILCLLFNMLGLIIGLLMYPSGSYERETMISGWIKCFVFQVIAGIILVCISFCAVGCMI